ncbi:hypothetical protein O181_011880 [Austropuccinia psidii MF-1]|uniref:CHCH domain-containing protein n=1 Tax=Austropuccinia psidii MF-1 TaxID=1389203 RepID=A0A9Q3GMC6_9BASI|nr:hypothetical protein [Austropuccinia psidii MF-1]
MNATRYTRQSSSVLDAGQSSIKPKIRKGSISDIAQAVSHTSPCHHLSIKYGECVSNKYQEVEKDICQSEFEQFKECVQSVLGRKW